MMVHKSSTRVRGGSASLGFSSANKIRMGSSNIALRLDPAVALLYTSILNAATNARLFLHLMRRRTPNHAPPMMHQHVPFHTLNVLNRTIIGRESLPLASGHQQVHTRFGQSWVAAGTRSGEIPRSEDREPWIKPSDTLESRSRACEKKRRGHDGSEGETIVGEDAQAVPGQVIQEKPYS